MNCKACEQAQASDGVAYYRLGNANLAVQGCRTHLAEAFRRLNLHDEWERGLESITKLESQECRAAQDIAAALLAKAQ